MIELTFTNPPQGFEFDARLHMGFWLAVDAVKQMIKARWQLFEVEIRGYDNDSHEVKWLTDLIQGAEIRVIFGREGYFEAGKEIKVSRVDYDFKTEELTVDIATE